MGEAVTRIQSAPFDPATAWQTVWAENSQCGAVASFTGLVRSDENLVALELEHYPGLTEQALDRIAGIALTRFELARAMIIHRIGRMDVGDPIVHVAASAPHRRAALDAVSFMIDVLKTQAPFWKKAYYAKGAEWIEPRAEDHSAATQWLDNTGKKEGV